MKQNMRNILYIVIVCVAFIVVVVANLQHNNAKVRDVEVAIEYDGCDTLITSDDVKELLHINIPHLMTQLVKEVDKKYVLQVVEKSPYLQQCDVHLSVNRKVVVRGTQRKPVVRVFGDSTEFYMDSVGTIMPLGNRGSVDVIVASGNFTNEKLQLKEVRELATYLSRKEEYKSMFDQIYVHKNGDLYLVPKVGNHVVMLGDLSDLDTKMHSLMEMYHKGMKKTGWDKYSVINLKYKDQVICKKRK